MQSMELVAISSQMAMHAFRYELSGVCRRVRLKT